MQVFHIIFLIYNIDKKCINYRNDEQSITKKVKRTNKKLHFFYFNNKNNNNNETNVVVFLLLNLKLGILIFFINKTKRKKVAKILK